MTATVQKWGNSRGIRLPKIILEELSLEENDKVEIIIENDTIVLKKSKNLLEELFKDYDGDYKCGEYDWGKPAGREYW